MVRKAALPILLTLLCCPPLFGQQWARDMFETTSHEFGSVARGAKAEFHFVLKNVYMEDVHISGAHSSCGCTSVRVAKPLLKTYEKGAIVASVNTERFTGHKGATITVTFDKPFPATVQLHVSSYIRGDVVFDPGSVQFGAVDQGTAVEKNVTVKCSGRPDWRIVDVTSTNPHVSAEIKETERGMGRVAYELLVRLDEDLPPGPVHDCLMLVTNDRTAPQIPLAVEGIVESGIMVSPPSLFMGVVQPGQKVSKQVVVRGKKPFRIVSVTCDGGCFEFDTSAQTDPKTLHLIPVMFVAGDKPGKVLQTIRIETDVEEATPELSAYAVVAP